MDSDLNGRLNADAFRMQIWNKENDELVYNSQTGAAGNAPRLRSSAADRL